jgi:hypothetical protein
MTQEEKNAKIAGLQKMAAEAMANGVVDELESLKDQIASAQMIVVDKIKDKSPK